MSLDFDAIEAQISTDIGSGIADGVNQSIGQLALPAEATITLSGTVIWAGSDTVLMTNTSQVAVGFSIKLDSDGNWFRVTAVTPNVSATIVSDYGAAIPTGAGASSAIDFTLPAPTSAQSIEDSLGAAIASAVRTALETFASDAEISGTTSGGDTIGPGVIS